MGKAVSKVKDFVGNKIVHPIEGGIKKVWGGISGAAKKIDRGTGGVLGKAYKFADQNKDLLAMAGPYGKAAATGLSAVDMAKDIGTNPQGAFKNLIRKKRPGFSTSDVNPAHPYKHTAQYTKIAY